MRRMIQTPGHHRPATGLAWDRPGGPVVAGGSLPARRSAPRRLAWDRRRRPLRRARARPPAACRARAAVLVVAFRRCRRVPGRSARWALCAARRRGRAAPQGGAAAASPRPGVGGPASPPPRPPGCGVVGPGLRRSAGSLAWDRSPLPPAPVSRAPRPPPLGPPSPALRAARPWHGPPRLLPRWGARGAAGGRPGITRAPHRQRDKRPPGGCCLTPGG